MRAKIVNRFIDEAGVVNIEYSYVAPRKAEVAFPVARAAALGALAAIGVKKNNLRNIGI